VSEERKCQKRHRFGDKIQSAFGITLMWSLCSAKNVWHCEFAALWHSDNMKLCQFMIGLVGSPCSPQWNEMQLIRMSHFSGRHECVGALVERSELGTTVNANFQLCEVKAEIGFCNSE